MVYRNMTVCLDNSTVSQRHLEFSLRLAQRHDAHLRALHMTREPLVFDAYEAAGPLYMEWEKVAAESEARSRDLCRSIAEKAGVQIDWRAYRTSAIYRLIPDARISDLVILGQRDPSGMDTDFDAAFHAKFILSLGRPVLLMPYEQAMPQKFDRVLVAWDGGREAIRALIDALPFLDGARQVELVCMEDNIDDRPASCDTDVLSLLARHGVKAEMHRAKDVQPAHGDWLLRHAAEKAADLLVMGAYGHSRLGEMILGGVTRTVLHQMNLPVLVSH